MIGIRSIVGLLFCVTVWGIVGVGMRIVGNWIVVNMKLSCDWEIGDFGEVDRSCLGLLGDVLYGFHFVKKVLKM